MLHFIAHDFRNIRHMIYAFKRLSHPRRDGIRRGAESCRFLLSPYRSDFPPRWFVSSPAVTMEVAVSPEMSVISRLRLKCDSTRAENRFRLSAKRTSPFKSVGASVQSTTGSRGVRISGSNAGYAMFRRSVKSTGYPLHSPVSPSLPLPWVTVCHHISTGLYHTTLHSRGTFNLQLHLLSATS